MEEEIISLLEKESLTAVQIGARLGVNSVNILKWCRRLKVQGRVSSFKNDKKQYVYVVPRRRGRKEVFHLFSDLVRDKDFFSASCLMHLHCKDLSVKDLLLYRKLCDVEVSRLRKTQFFIDWYLSKPL